MYREAFVKSWKDLKDNPIIFLPDAAILILNITLGLLFLKYSGILKLITDPTMLTREVETMMPALKLFIKENMLRLILSGLLFIFTTFFIGSGFTAMKLGTMKDLMEKQKLSFRKMIGNGRYVWQVISMKMMMFVIGAVTFLFIFGTGVILSAFFFKGYGVWVSTLFLPFLVIILQWLLLFRYPIMLLEKKHTITAVKDSIGYFLKNKKYVFVTWLIITAVSFASVPVNAYVGFEEQKMATLSIAVLAGYFLNSIIRVVINVWSDMFRFRSYRSKF